MNLQNGYKVVYEKAENGKRTFYASKTGICDPAVDTKLGDTFTDSDYMDKVIYEYKGSFYVSTGSVPSYDENGVPTDERLDAFDEVFIKADQPNTANVLDDGTTETTQTSEQEDSTESE